MNEPYDFKSEAEKKADLATKLEPFAINLGEVRRTASEMLWMIGRNGIFDQYSKHDISHIDELLQIADWVIDNETKQIMTPADWLMITLSIYFHDMGMLVTEEEFANRDKSSFVDFKEELLSGRNSSPDYVSRIQELSPPDQEKFLYQEFVRKTHAIRVRRWVEGKKDAELGYTQTQVDEIQRVLGPLDIAFKRDLALIAESHHLDDLEDLKKYNPRKSYGATDDEIANLQFCAIVLRTVDLLHMRRDRTPSVLFRLINPSDPISQREWAKQNAIKRVMPQLGKNADGVPDEAAPKDTIEVHAHFTDENGFFGLTFFLTYVKNELRKSYKWNEDCRKTSATKHRFVWRDIVDDAVETEGFLRKTFSFALDQHKILDLLIGHTLYNDTSVVLRELVQNAIDAVRLKAFLDLKPPGSVQIQWNSKERILSVIDTGTGMTQEIVENHLLRVGSSRYQDPQFREKNPNFSPISRFGIGVLSTFMISDDVEITTCSPDEELARRISLRSVHGRYLIRTFDKATAPELEGIRSHGTIVRLKVRPSARLVDIMTLARRWIIVPACQVSVKIDDQSPVKIGFRSPKEAIESQLEQAGFRREDSKAPRVRIIEKTVGGMTLAYAVRWSDIYKDWSLMAPVDRSSTGYAIPSTCIEGIAVEAATPGMRSQNILAVANATGERAPKTNVARSSLEATPEQEELVSALYESYLELVTSEIARLRTEENFSLTWAVTNSTLLIHPLVGERAAATAPNKLRERMHELPIFLIERKGQRSNVSLTELLDVGAFWTVDSALVRSSEHLVKETSGNSSVSALTEALNDPAVKMPEGVYLSNFDTTITSSMIEAEYEPAELIVHADYRRVDVKWNPISDKPRWSRMREFVDRANRVPGRIRNIQEFLEEYMVRSRYGSRTQYISLWIPTEDLPAGGMDDYVAVTFASRLFMRPATNIARFFQDLSNASDSEIDLKALIMYAAIFTQFLGTDLEAVEAALKRMSADVGAEYLQHDEKFLKALSDSPMGLFDASAWSRRGVGGLYG